VSSAKAAAPAGVDEQADEPIGPSPLGSARYHVSQLIADLNAVAAHLERRLTEAEQRRPELRDRAEQAEVVRRHVINNLGRLRPDDIEQAFVHSASLRVELAVLEERMVEMTARVSDVGGELEALRGVHRSLDDLADLDGANAADGAARFRSASRQVFQIIEEERMRIARDMHDGPAQSMANLVLQAEVLERLLERDPHLVLTELADFKNGVRDALEETRRLIFDLRPMTLDDLGLVPTLRRLVREYGDKHGIVARFHLVGEERRLPGNYEAVLFRIIQEALTNVRKHAHATTAEVNLTLQPRKVVAVVKDDGEGFDVAATEARLGRTRNLGLISMRERADLEKGSLEVKSKIGSGTEVRVNFNF
jgi:two-component system, NarL family, sensor histidine kinase DegS